MTEGDRRPYDRALRAARTAAYPPGEFVGQESFMQAGEILALARRAGVGPDTTVLDLCCGVAGPGRLITSELHCSYLGIDQSPSALAVARARTAGLPCRFEAASIPPTPTGPFDVVLLLETMLAFRDKEALLREVATALVPGGRFACTVEAGLPLSAAERQAMPGADTVWLVPVGDLLRMLAAAGLHVRRVQDCTRSHRSVADALVDALLAERPAIATELDAGTVDDLVATHRLWSAWMATRRVRKLAIVTEKTTGR